MKIYLRLLLGLLLALQCALCSRIRQYIYQTLDARYGCFGILNGTHQFGCSGSISGNTGIVYVVNKTTDLDQLFKIEEDQSYVVVLDRKLFSVGNLEKFKAMSSQSGKASVVGVILAFTLDKSKMESFSEDTQCPNQFSGLYKPGSDEFNYCMENSWNPAGNSMLRRHWNFPIILLNNQSQLSDIYTCHSRHNTLGSAWPRCTLRLYTPMMAVASTRLCWSRSTRSGISEPVSYCSPLGSSNVLARLGPAGGILVTARLDGAAVFDQLAPGADSAVVGTVALLTAARILTGLARKAGREDVAVMFALFSGESFDYIGSERFVYDAVNSANQTGFRPRRVDLTRISHVIELGQLASSRKLTIHSDPVTRRNGTDSQVKYLIDELKAAASDRLSVSASSPGVPLPPASLHTLLKARSDLPGVFISDHEAAFTNRFYHSVYDTGDSIGWTGNRTDKSSEQLIDQIAAIAQTVAVTAFKVATNEDAPAAEVNTSWVSELLDCYLVRSNCSAFLRVLDTTLDSRAHRKLWLDNDAPIPTYVSVSVAGTKHWHLVRLTANLLASATGEVLTNISSEAECKSSSSKEEHVYRWLLDRSIPDGSGYCVRSFVWLTPAVSPAFQIPDYDWSSGRFSSWSESRWLQFDLQMFLVPSPLHQWLHLVAGLLTTLVFSVLIIVVVRHADRVFPAAVDTTRRSGSAAPADRSYGSVGLSQGQSVVA